VHKDAINARPPGKPSSASPSARRVFAILKISLHGSSEDMTMATNGKGTARPRPRRQGLSDYRP